MTQPMAKRRWATALSIFSVAAAIGGAQCRDLVRLPRGGSTAAHSGARGRQRGPLAPGGAVGTAAPAAVRHQGSHELDLTAVSSPEVSSALESYVSEVATAVPGGGDPKAQTELQAYRKAVLRTVLVLMSAVAFGIGTIAVKGRKSGLEFFAGYLVEQSLSVDNLFVFIMLFEYFKVPPEYQGRVLTWGIIGAVSMRAVMIVVGVAAIQRFRWVVLAFSGILLASAYKLITESDDHEEGLKDNFVLRLGKMLVRSTDHYDGEKFFTMVDGVKRATPLLLCLVCIELSDFVFAVDSIPAVLGVSKDSFIVYTSNVFAIMALRSLYTLVSHAVTDLPYLKPAVALVLGFVGIKMGLEFFHYHIGIGPSLLVVATALTGGTVMSIWENKKRAKRAEAEGVLAAGNAGAACAR